MGFRRRILRYGPSPDELHAALDDRAIAGCQFELHRLGGCGRGEVKLRDGFESRQQIPVGQWVACEYDDGDRWYLGRVEERRAESPGGVTLRLEGMSIQLNEVYPGGFGMEADGQRPHRYAMTDRFADDPDYLKETADTVERPEDVIRLLISQYVVPATDIKAEAGLIENSDVVNELVSVKFHGEETVRSILKDLALRVQNASWGVDELGRFFLLQARNTQLATYQAGVDLVDLTETESRESLYNRVLLTGGYLYQPLVSGADRTPLRWRGNYRQPESVTAYGERRIRLWVPWIRTSEDSRQFVREFFRVYAQPSPAYAIQAVAQSTCPRPWLGRVAVHDRQGELLIAGQPETVRVRFDNTPRLLMELGPDDPRTHWPEPPYDERFPVVADIHGSGASGPGGNISVTSGIGPGGGGSGEPGATSSLDSGLSALSEVLSSGLGTTALGSSALASSSFGESIDPSTGGESSLDVESSDRDSLSLRSSEPESSDLTSSDLYFSDFRSTDPGSEPISSDSWIHSDSFVDSSAFTSSGLESSDPSGGYPEESSLDRSSDNETSGAAPSSSDPDSDAGSDPGGSGNGNGGGGGGSDSDSDDSDSDAGSGAGSSGHSNAGGGSDHPGSDHPGSDHPGSDHPGGGSGGESNGPDWSGGPPGFSSTISPSNNDDWWSLDLNPIP